MSNKQLKVFKQIYKICWKKINSYLCAFLQTDTHNYSYIQNIYINKYVCM